jgi:hypothetical protein
VVLGGVAALRRTSEDHNLAAISTIREMPGRAFTSRNDDIAANTSVSRGFPG